MSAASKRAVAAVAVVELDKIVPDSECSEVLLETKKYLQASLRAAAQLSHRRKQLAAILARTNAAMAKMSD